MHGMKTIEAVVIREVRRAWREGKTLGEIAAQSGLNVYEVNRILILTGEVGRSIDIGMEKLLAERTYTIAPLTWKRQVMDINDRRAFYYRAEAAWGSFSVYPVGWWAYVNEGPLKPKLPSWQAVYNEEREVPTGGECRTVAECKAAANAYHREQVAQLLIPVPRKQPG